MDCEMRFFFLFYILIFNFSLSHAVEFKGKFEQGSFILGKTKSDSKVIIDKKIIRVSKDGYFAFGLGRDRKNNIIIQIIKDGKLKTIEKKVFKRKYRIQKINGLPKNKLHLRKKYMIELKKKIYLLVKQEKLIVR